MDEKFFTPSRFRILSEIARKPRSASEIARAIGMSLPYVLAQISLLEAKDIITKKQIEHYKQVGKPKQYYHITKPIIRGNLRELKLFLIKKAKNQIININ